MKMTSWLSFDGFCLCLEALVCSLMKGLSLVFLVVEDDVVEGLACVEPLGLLIYTLDKASFTFLIIFIFHLLYDTIKMKSIKVFFTRLSQRSNNS